MVFEVVTKPHAWFDLIEAMLWYDSRAENLGREFFKDFEIAVDRIKLNPNSFKEIIPGVKRILIKNSPIKFSTLSLIIQFSLLESVMPKEAVLL